MPDRAAASVDTCARCGDPETAVCPRCGDPLCVDHAPMPGTPCTACRRQRITAGGALFATCGFFGLWIILLVVIGNPGGRGPAFLTALLAGAVTFILSAAGRVLLRPPRVRQDREPSDRRALPQARTLRRRPR